MDRIPSSNVSFFASPPSVISTEAVVPPRPCRRTPAASSLWPIGCSRRPAQAALSRATLPPPPLIASGNLSDRRHLVPDAPPRTRSQPLQVPDPPCSTRALHRDARARALVGTAAAAVAQAARKHGPRPAILPPQGLGVRSHPMASGPGLAFSVSREKDRELLLRNPVWRRNSLPPPVRGWDLK